MSKQYIEAAFEAAIEHNLLTIGGYTKADPELFDRARGLDPTVLLGFIQETQPNEWEYLQNIQGKKAAETLLDDLCRALNSEHEGCLKVLRHMASSASASCSTLPTFALPAVSTPRPNASTPPTASPSLANCATATSTTTPWTSC